MNGGLQLSAMHNQLIKERNLNIGKFWNYVLCVIVFTRIQAKRSGVFFFFIYIDVVNL